MRQYEVKRLDDRIASPARWVVYRVTTIGRRAYALTFTEDLANFIARKLVEHENETDGNAPPPPFEDPLAYGPGQDAVTDEDRGIAVDDWPSKVL